MSETATRAEGYRDLEAWARTFGTVRAFGAEGTGSYGAGLSRFLHDRGLSERVLVWCWGEFGRTPRVNRDAGRDHWPQAMSVLMAGGGLRPGVVVGATDRKGEQPVSRPLKPADVLATVYRQLGIDTAQTFAASGKRPVAVLNHGAPIEELF